MPLVFGVKTGEVYRRLFDAITGQWLCDQLNLNGVKCGSRLERGISPEGKDVVVAGRKPTGSAVVQGGRSRLLRAGKSARKHRFSSSESKRAVQTVAVKEGSEGDWLSGLPNPAIAVKLVSKALQKRGIGGEGKEPLTDEALAEAEERALAKCLLDRRNSTLMLFYSKKCHLCNHLKPVVADVASKQQGWLNMAFVNVDLPHWMPEIVHYGVNYVPCFVLLDRRGQALVKSGPPQNANVVIEGLERIVNGGRQLQGREQQLLARRRPLPKKPENGKSEGESNEDE